MRRSVRGAICAAAVVLIAGCGGGVNGTPTVSGPNFDPCSIPAEVLVPLGVDPSKPNPEVIEGEPGDWKYCRWLGDWFILGVISTSRSLAEFESNQTFVSVGNTAVNGRPTYTFQSAAVELRDDCSVAVSSSNGTLLVRFYKRLSQEPRGDLCTFATVAAEQIEPHLPA